MPAKSKAQQELMAIAMHEPEKVYSKNKGVLKMKKKSLADFAKTSRKDLPEKVEAKKKKSAKNSTQASEKDSSEKVESKYNILNKLYYAADKTKSKKTKAKAKSSKYSIKTNLSNALRAILEGKGGKLLRDMARKRRAK